MISEDVKEIPDHICKKSQLREISFARLSQVVRIGVGAFSDCKQLYAIEIPASVEVLCESCFKIVKVFLGSLLRVEAI